VPNTRDDARRRMLAGVPVTERRLELAAIPTAVLEGGAGPPLVLLHGAGEFAGLWLRVVPGLAAGHRVVAPDLPGHGASAAPPGPLGAERLLAWLGELVERTCPTPPTLVGRASAAPWRPASPPPTATAWPGWCWSAPSAWPRSTRPRRSVRPCAASPRSRPPPPATGCSASASSTWTACPGSWASAGPPWPTTPWTGPGPRPWRRPWTGCCPSSSCRRSPADLDRIPVPVTLIWGRQDLQARLAVAEAAAAHHSWPLRVIDGAGDDPPLEQPAAFLAALRDSLAAGATAGRAER
jgi:pimeloyl-ACP methyl ester carboxylesterase